MSLFYKDQGKGYPVVLIHGFCETHVVWNELAEKLSQYFRIISIDLPGFGKSKSLTSPFSIDAVAEHVTDELSKLGIRECSIIGHSLGGYVSLAIADNNPDLVKSFGLFHSTALADSSEKKISRNKVVEFVQEHGVDPFIRSFIPPLFFDQTAPYVQEVVQLALGTPLETLVNYTHAMRDRTDHTGIVQRFTGPILFVAGDQDGVIPVESVEKQASTAKMPALHILQNVAHMGMFEAPEQAFFILKDFIESTQP